jgi:hypothetical protein
MKNKLILISIATIALGFLGGYEISKSKNMENVQIPGISEETTTRQKNSIGKGMNGTQGMGIGQGTGNRGEPNRGNCLSDECLLVEDLEFPVGGLTDTVVAALSDALEDEYKAYATYEAVINKFGSTRPFSMIIGAEEQHIASLKAVFDKYGLEVPENIWVGSIEAPESLQAACQTGVEAEIANASLYKDNLLPAVSDYEDITSVFTNLMNASQQKHLPAFERCN